MVEELKEFISFVLGDEKLTREQTRKLEKLNESEQQQLVSDIDKSFNQSYLKFLQKQKVAYFELIGNKPIKYKEIRKAEQENEDEQTYSPSKIKHKKEVLKEITQLEDLLEKNHVDTINDLLTDESLQTEECLADKDSYFVDWVDVRFLQELTGYTNKELIQMLKDSFTEIISIKDDGLERFSKGVRSSFLYSRLLRLSKPEYNNLLNRINKFYDFKLTKAGKDVLTKRIESLDTNFSQ